MWRGSGICGKSTTFGRGKIGMTSGSVFTTGAGAPTADEARLAADDLDGEIPVARAVELGGDDRLELAEHELARGDREGERVAEQRRLQVRVRVLPIAVREARVVVAVALVRAHHLVEHRLHVVEEGGLPLVDEE